MPSVVIVGGGLIGMLSAHFLVNAGCSVMVLERSYTGRESSWAGGGILSPLHPWRYPDAVTALAKQSQVRYRAFCDLLSETGVDPEWTESGMLMLQVGDQHVACDWARRWNYPIHELDPGATRECEPSLGGAAPSLWMSAVAQVRNPRLTKALRLHLDANGVVFREAAAAGGFEVQGGRLTGIRLESGEIIPTGLALVAGGAWTGGLMSSTGLRLPVVPVRGQMVLFKGHPGLLRRIVLSGNRYLIPRRDGRILAGSTLEQAGFEKVTTPEALAELRAAAVAMVPLLAELPVEAHWAGLRPGSPTGIPFIGPHPAIEGLFVNAGHFRNGVVLGLASARLAADLVLGRDPEIDPLPYRLDRPAEPPTWEMDRV